MTRKLILRAPEDSLILIAGPAGSGKSSLAARLFQGQQVVSSDRLRAMICDNENNQSLSKEAFDLLHQIVGLRLQMGCLTVVDATNVQHEHRQSLLRLAQLSHSPTYAIVLDYPLEVCWARSQKRKWRVVPKEVIERQSLDLQASLATLLHHEGYEQVVHLLEPEEGELLEFETYSSGLNHRQDQGPFDLIGDVHGCYKELQMLLQTLGYTGFYHPQNRKLVFVGDLVDRGPDSLSVLRFVKQAVEAGRAHALRGNHEQKLLSYLRGRSVLVRRGLETTVSELDRISSEEKQGFMRFIDELPHHIILDRARLVVAHAGITESKIGRSDKATQTFCLYGDVRGEGPDGRPLRHPWFLNYHGQPKVVYGHSPVHQCEWINNSMNLDTGCVYGGKLSALRYPEQEVVSQNSLKIYYSDVDSAVEYRA